MRRIAQVEIISANNLDIYKWLRKNMDWLQIKEAKDLSNQRMINFYGDYEKAIAFFNYLQGCIVNSARLIIDISYDTRSAIGSYAFTTEQIEEDNKFAQELNGKPEQK